MTEPEKKAIYINMSDDEGRKLYARLNVVRVKQRMSWKQAMLDAMSVKVVHSDPKLSRDIQKYIDKPSVK